MELTIYDVIKGAVRSEKAYKLNRSRNQLALEVHLDATKPMIKQALEKLFEVKVDNVRTMVRKYTTVRGVARRRNATPSIKREKVAYVRLAEGYAIDLFEQAGVSSSEAK